MSHGYGYRSDQRLRKENQDTLGVFEIGGLPVVVVCDGMGGHVGGRQASAIAVRTLHDVLSDPETGFQAHDIPTALVKAVEAANRAIYDTARKNYRLMGMGTTVVAAVIDGDTAHIAHVGDSRAYLLRDGEIQALTRDHTMVNLFVDAELLSPEDAATHPEAHVLSRSLGVERQVDVELSAPLDLVEGDRLLLCSDGVHGVTGASGLAIQDWSNPQRGVDAVLEAVARAEGDDNATLVAYGVGLAGTTARLTPPPDLELLEQEARTAPVASALVPVSRPAHTTLAPLDDDTDGLSPDGAAPVEPSEHSAEAIGRRPSQPTVQEAPAPRRRPSNLVILVGVAAVAMLATLAGTRLLRPDGGASRLDAPRAPVIAAPPTPREPLAEDELSITANLGAVLGLRSRCLDCTSSFAPPTAFAYLAGGNDPEVAVAFFSPSVPPAPRRLPVNSQYAERKGNGAEQTAIIKATRNKQCRAALDTVKSATARSIDFAGLFSTTWFCFHDHHQLVLKRSTAATFEDFLALVPHLQGDLPVPTVATTADDSLALDGAPATDDDGAALADGDTPDDDAADAPDDDTPDDATADDAEDTDAASAADLDTVPPPLFPEVDLPDALWASGATGGLEYRLAMFEHDGDYGGFRDVMLDIQGGPQLADHLGVDVLFEASAAAAIVRLDDVPARAIPVWARRVMIATQAMNGATGDLVRTHRPDLAEIIDGLLLEATDGLSAVEPDALQEAAVDARVPPMVVRALEIAHEHPLVPLPSGTDLPIAALTASEEEAEAEADPEVDADARRSPPPRRARPRPAAPAAARPVSARASDLSDIERPPPAEPGELPEIKVYTPPKRELPPGMRR